MDPESSVRGGASLSKFCFLLLSFSVDEGSNDPITTKKGHHWPASETPFSDFSVCVGVGVSMGGSGPLVPLWVREWSLR